MLWTTRAVAKTADSITVPDAECAKNGLRPYADVLILTDAWTMMDTNTKMMNMKNKLFSYSSSEGSGRFLSKWIDVYWGPKCEEMFDCKWCVNFPKMTIEWNGGIPDGDEAPDVRRAEDAVKALLNAQEAMLHGWAEAAPPCQRLSARQQELWRRLHEKADDVRAELGEFR